MTQSITRREFMMTGAASVGALCVTFYAPSSHGSGDILLAGWIRIDADGEITLLVSTLR